MGFRVTCVALYTLIFVSSSEAYRQFDRSRSSESSEVLSPSSEFRPITSRIQKLPPRYSQHYFQPFQPIVESESKTHFSLPNNPANFFGPQSYWGQIANKLIDNVVGQVGGSYASSAENQLSTKSPVFKEALKELAKPETKLSDEKLETFRKALKMENVTRFQHSRYPEFSRKVTGIRNYVSVEDLNKGGKGDKTRTDELRSVEESSASRFGNTGEISRESNVPTEFVEPREGNNFGNVQEASISSLLPRKENSFESIQEITIPSRPRPKFWISNNRATFVDGGNQKVISSAEIVKPTRPPSSTLRQINPYQYYYSQQTTTTQSPSEYGVLPTLLLRNPNARTKFYHLDKYANPQFPIRKIIKLQNLGSPELKGKDNLNPVVIEARKKLQELRRKPARYPHPYSSRTSASGFDDSISNGIRFRSALKKILAEFRKTHPVSQRAREREEVQLQRLAQQKAARTNRRRHPGQRRVVMLPARYEPNEEFSRWRS
ncbi:hypothetical protein FO519_003780 [Halicephalobus sp. NKZ332]|nr:hypothetical protein FO519_003780 [Halicephalobus sp. NKZ332]